MITSLFITGLIALVCLIPLLIKYPLRKLHFDKLNARLMKLHESASGIFFLVGIAHMIIAFVKSVGITVWAVFSGIGAFIVSTVLITDCHLAKNHEKKMKRHRIYSLILAVLVIFHIVKT